MGNSINNVKDFSEKQRELEREKELKREYYSRFFEKTRDLPSKKDSSSSDKPNSTSSKN